MDVKILVMLRVVYTPVVATVDLTGHGGRESKRWTSVQEGCHACVLSVELLRRC